MRFNEIANPEDQLALWKLVSDTMWGAFAQELTPSSMTLTQPKSVDRMFEYFELESSYEVPTKVEEIFSVEYFEDHHV